VVSPLKIEGAVDGKADETDDVFSVMLDEFPKEVPYKEIHYVESLENYIRIITSKKPLVVRLSLKETELRLPAPPFIRISRSCIVNANHIQTVNGDTIFVHGKELKVGKVFKRYVEKFLR
jgi:DNA-binding LytR/AlgR family response regulator